MNWWRISSINNLVSISGSKFQPPIPTGWYSSRCSIVANGLICMWPGEDWKGRVGNHHCPLKKRTMFSGWIIDEKPWEIKKQWHKTIGNQFWFGAQNWSSSNWWEFEELFKLLHFSRTSCFWHHNLCSPLPSWYWSIHVGFTIPWFHEYQLFFPNSMEGSSLFFPWKTGVIFASFVRFQPCFFLWKWFVFFVTL